MPKLLLCFLILIVTATLRAADDPGVIQKLTFFDSFDDSLTPQFFAGTGHVTGQPPSPDGRLKGCVHFLTSDGITIPSQLNLDQSIGTFSFWFKPDRSLFDRNSSNGQKLFSLLNSNFQLVANPKDQAMFFMTGTQLPGHDFEWDYASQFHLDSLSADRWTCITLTWDVASGEKQIFLDGKRVSRSNTLLMRTGSIDSELHFAGAPGSYDELAIWNRVLSPTEIAKIASDPESLQQAVATLPPAVPETPWLIYPDLVYTGYTQALLSPGESFRVRIPIANRSKQNQTGRMTVQCVDIWDKPVGKALHFDLDLSPGESKPVPVELTPNRLGTFRASVTIEVGGTKRSRDVASFAVLPAGDPPANPFFGTHVNGEADIPQACRRLGFTANRVHNMTQFTWWTRMQPTPDHWAMIDSEKYDQYNQLGFTHLGQWFAVPNWAAVGPDGVTPPRDAGYPSGWIPTNVDALRAYVRESLKRFPLIKNWEIWNEPHVSMFWYGSPKQYAELCAIIYDEAKKARPDITVYAQISPQGPWPRAALAAGVLDHCDGLSFHYYVDALGDPQSAARDVEELRGLIKQYSKRDPMTVPLIQSEGAVTGSTFLRGLDFPGMLPESKRDPLTARQAAEMYVKSRAVLLSLGVKQDYYYSAHPFTPPLREDFSLFDVTNGPKPKAVAANQFIWQLDGGSFAQAISRDGFRAYLFARKDSKTLAVLFADNGAKFNLPRWGSAFDLMGNPIDDAKLTIDQTPVYLVDSANAKSVAERLNSAKLDRISSATVATVAGVEQPKHMDDFPVAVELGRDRLLPVDLSAVANASLADGDNHGWTNEGEFNDARMIPQGTQIWLGVPVSIGGKSPADKSVLTMFGRNAPRGPKSITIPMQDSKCRGLFFTHTASWADGEIGNYIITYSDGTTLTLPITTGKNIGDWWTDQQPGEESRTVSFKHPNPLQADKPWRFVRMWYWENPKSSLPIRSITVSKIQNLSNFVLLAVTRAVW
jgi:hypothetical protein